tara:strand:- start:4229 stop:4843 length:615 start_codon:yes stop_codon:yes gene_type:complete
MPRQRLPDHAARKLPFPLRNLNAVHPRVIDPAALCAHFTGCPVVTAIYQGNRMSMKTLLAASIAVIALTGFASAQNVSLDPTFGTVTLQPGFLPDPYEVSLVAGGSINAATISNDCAGMIANAPDFRLNYGGGGSQVFIGVNSAADTTLVVNAPDGGWYCNDDYNGLNPVVGGESPMAGQYDIWVGTYGADTAPATLFITEYDQ